MRKNLKLLGAIAVLATLGACSGGEGDEQSAGEEAGAGEGNLEPGKYEMTVSVIDMEMPAVPGMPDNAENMFRDSMESTTTYCITPEQAEQSAFTRTREQAESQMGGDCEIQQENNSETSLDMTIACTPEGGEMTMDMKGNMTADGVKIRMTADGTISGQTMSFTTEHVSKRVGECDEEDQSANS